MNPPPELGAAASLGSTRARGPRRHITHLRRRAAGLPPAARGLLWAAASGLVFSQLNALMRKLSMQLDPFETQFLRYLFGMLVMLPLVLRAGLRAYLPQRFGPQFARGAVHTVGLALWFTALPKIGLADMTAIGFTGPIFIMIGEAPAARSSRT